MESIIIIIISILAGLYTTKFFVEVFNEKIELGNRYIFIKALISTTILMIALSLFNDFVLQKYSILTKYSIIPIYLVFHLIIACVLCCILWGILIIINKTNNNIKETQKVINTNKSKNERDINIPLLTKSKCFFINGINYINKHFNPLYTINLKEINVIRIIKIIFLLCYLLSGIIMLSYVSNYLDLKIIAHELEEISYFNRDYELYKSVFVISLIPFSINYIITRDNKFNKKE
ncbi:hypothetical protein JCM1393_00410 [Clostridium carnis]